MPTIQVYVSDETYKVLAERAEKMNVSVARYANLQLEIGLGTGQSEG